MPIRIELSEDGRIMRFQVEEPWKPEEIIPAKEKSRSIYTQAQNTVHALVDLRRATVNLPLLQASQQVIGGEPFPNSGQIAVVGISRMMQMIAYPLLRLAGGGDTVAFFNTVEEAKAYLQRQIAQEGRGKS